MIIIRNIIKELLSILVFLRFKNIWELKAFLIKNKKQSGIYATVYSYYIEKKNSYIGINTEFANTPYLPHGISNIYIKE